MVVVVVVVVLLRELPHTGLGMQGGVVRGRVGNHHCSWTRGLFCDPQAQALGAARPRIRSPQRRPAEDELDELYFQ